jgi:hypothetical protein
MVGQARWFKYAVMEALDERWNEKRSSGRRELERPPVVG